MLLSPFFSPSMQGSRPSHMFLDHRSRKDVTRRSSRSSCSTTTSGCARNTIRYKPFVNNTHLSVFVLRVKYKPANKTQLKEVRAGRKPCETSCGGVCSSSWASPRTWWVSWSGWTDFRSTSSTCRKTSSKLILKPSHNSSSNPKSKSKP